MSNPKLNINGTRKQATLSYLYAFTPTLSTSMVSNSKSTKAPDTKDGNHITCISASVGGFLFLAILFILLFYCYKNRRKSREARQHSRHTIYKPQSIECSEIGHHNHALHVSDTDIKVGVSPPKRNTLLLQEVCIVPNGVKLGALHGIGKELEEISYDISIRLITPWNEVYENLESREHKIMKEEVQSSMEHLYSNYGDFRTATLLQFRQGSVLADIRLKFSLQGIDPLQIVQKAVKQGRCSKLEVDKNFFELKSPESTSNRDFEHEPASINCPASISCPARIESGYGSQFDPSEVIEKLHFQKARDDSQKSNDSTDSVTSEIGTSHSVSPKSCSSTNISIHSFADDEILKHEKSRIKSLKSIVMPEKKPRETKSKIGIPHVALFNFSPQDYRELALRQGELIYVTFVDTGGWVKAVNESGIQGWAPQNFVVQIDVEQYANTKKVVESIICLDQVIGSFDTLSPDEPPEQRFVTVDTAHDVEPTYDQVTPDEDISELFIAIFPFEPSAKNELKLEIGDLVDVVKTSETGWWKGCCLRRSHEEDGWFPSSYVKPQADLDFSEYLDKIEDKGSVSDSEVHVKPLSLSQKNEHTNCGYTSEDGIARLEKKKALVASKESLNGTIQTAQVGENTEPEMKANVLPRWDKPKREAPSPPRNYNTTIRPVKDKIHSTQPKTPPARLRRNTDGSSREGSSDEEPPTKPVPPKPRKRHIQDKIRSLAAEGKLGSTDSLITRSTDSLVMTNRHSVVRRNSEEIVTDDEGVARNNMFRVKPIDRLRPRSFQETPKSTFFYLSNWYASSMKSAWSFPSLNTSGMNDQIKLSPEDERPYLDPIPRRTKRNSLPELESPSKDVDMILGKQGNSDSVMTDLSKQIIITYPSDESFNEVSQANGILCKAPPKPIRRSFSGDLETDETHKQFIKLPSEIGDGPTKPLPPSPLVKDDKYNNRPYKKPVIAEKPISLKSPESVVTSVSMEVNNMDNSSTKPSLPTRTSSKNIILKKLLEEKQMRDNQSSRVNDQISPPRTSISRIRPINRSFTSVENIIFEEGEQSFSGKLQNKKLNFINRSEENLSGYNRKYRNHVENRSSPQVEKCSPPHSKTVARHQDHLFEHDPQLLAYSHKRYHSEPRDGCYNSNTSQVVKEHLKYVSRISSVSETTSSASVSETTTSDHLVPENNNAVSPPTISKKSQSNITRKTTNDHTDTRDSIRTSCESTIQTRTIPLQEGPFRKISEEPALSSRASSMQSLSSVSSTRSTTSSKHEQMNLRRAKINVFGQGEHDLSFKIGAILYEIRPRNKLGLCFGVLDDSTQGWYPADAVEIFYDV